MSTSKQLIIIYNADSTVRGKLNYAFRKLSSNSSDNPACAACDLTHGGLSLSEAPGWTMVKSEIESQQWKVTQWHRDEVEVSVKEWVQANGVRYPVALSRAQDGTSQEPKLVADSAELAKCAGDATKLYALLSEKGLVHQGSQPSL
ncbi:hypothetical protein LTR37_000057 [Vermiconidia calcicola]|uniref:Uncharacterized protein n=1 Tax=Vermiconidia calcicola TaxID=1690605 RepID=A0ACC3NZA9_9PEZI|nr:hypothetical protein LTR37_000057 [Vermiconidia calcicola]